MILALFKKFIDCPDKRGRMAHLLFDFSDPKQAKLFPQHGWAINSQGAKILWLPLLRLFKFLRKTLEEKGRSGQSHPSILHDSLAFLATLQNLAITLRELHRVTRLSRNLLGNLDPLTLTADHRAYEMVPLYIDLAFSYLRRTPDLLVMACRPLLFEHWQSVPQKFKDWIANLSQLESRKPLCDFTILSEAVSNHTEWFNAVRGRALLPGKKGIKDALENRAVQLRVVKQKRGSNRPRFTVMVNSKARDVERDEDMLARINEAITGLCRLMTGIHAAIGVGSRYQLGDQLLLLGNDEDIVGYWPQIGS
jgi:hypothetical protein